MQLQLARLDNNNTRLYEMCRRRKRIVDDSQRGEAMQVVMLQIAIMKCVTWWVKYILKATVLFFYSIFFSISRSVYINKLEGYDDPL